MIVNDDNLHSYTELVIELWDRADALELNLSDIGGGDSQAGVDVISDLALAAIRAEKWALGQDLWWDGQWVDCIQEYAAKVIPNEDVSNIPNKDIAESVAMDLMVKWMETTEEGDK